MVAAVAVAVQVEVPAGLVVLLVGSASSKVQEYNDNTHVAAVASTTKRNLRSVMTAACNSSMTLNRIARSSRSSVVGVYKRKMSTNGGIRS